MTQRSSVAILVQRDNIFMNLSNKSFDSNDSLYARGACEHEHIIRTRSGLMLFYFKHILLNFEFEALRASHELTCSTSFRKSSSKKEDFRINNDFVSSRSIQVEHVLLNSLYILLLSEKRQSVTYFFQLFLFGNIVVTFLLSRKEKVCQNDTLLVC